MKNPQDVLNKGYLWFVTTVILLLQCLPVKSQTVLDSIQETGVLKVAVREDAAPFGYIGSAGEVQGYCLDFLALLETKLKQELKRNTIAVRLLKSTVNNRFSLVDEGSIDLECGPNTIRDLSSSQVSFSQPFFVAETKFLIPEAQASEIDLDGDLANIKIGVINDTSTQELIAERYPLANLVLFSGVTARSRGVQAVAQGKVSAMVSDGILLLAEAAKQQLSKDEYILIPERSLACNLTTEISTSDRYGMIITKDTHWRDFINSVIVSPESQQLFRQWFGSTESFTEVLDFVNNKAIDC